MEIVIAGCVVVALLGLLYFYTRKLSSRGRVGNGGWSSSDSSWFNSDSSWGGDCGGDGGGCGGGGD